MKHRHAIVRAASLFALTLTAITAVPFAHASCGSASCTLLTDRFALANWDHVGWTIDTRLEFITQDRLRAGTHNISADQVTGEEAIERRTRNINLVTTVERAFDANWSLALRLPVVSRDHTHDLLDEATGGLGATERWSFTRLGDVQLLGRYQQAEAASGFGWALVGGFKLPTGSRSIANTDGARAERALQPGSGTTDIVLGVSMRQLLSLTDSVSGAITVQQALTTREAFKPGNKVEVSVQWAHAFSHDWSAVLQLNAAQRARDSGAQAEPDLSGSTTIALSPGVSVSVDEATGVYAFLQLPVYQDMNGIQLVPRYGLAIGVNHAF